jgi:hypothetical protein
MSDETWVSLAEATGFSARAFRDWRKLPGAPKEPDREKWIAFIEEHQLGVVGNKVSADREHWLTQQAEFRAKLLEIEHKQAEGKIVYKSDLDARDMRIAAAQKTALYDILTGELPVKSEGKSASEIRALNREAADRVCEVMQARLAEWAEIPSEV